MPIILVPKSKKKKMLQGKLEAKPEKLEIKSKKLEVKPKNKSLIRRKKGKQVLSDMSEDFTPSKQPTVPKTEKDKLQEKKDIQKLKDNLKKDKKKPLTPKQKKLDVDKDGQLEASDFEMLRKKKSVVSAMTGGQIVAMMYDD